MFSKAIVATDMSPGAKEMLECLPDLRLIGVDSLVLVWVVEVSQAQGLALSFQKDGEERLEEKATQLREEGFSVEVEAPIGFPAREIIKSARDHEASLIVIASRGADTLRERYLGSTVSAVVRMTDIPILIERISMIREPDRVSCRVVREKKFSRILFATDFSQAAEQAREAVSLLSRLAETVVLMSVVDEGSTEEEIERAKDHTSQSLRDLREALENESETNVVVRSATGIASENIINISEEEDATLIVMGMRGKGRVQGISLGSTAEATARRAKRPVLLIPALNNQGKN